MANDPLPVAQRPPRIAALERELDGLHRVEEALVAAAIAAGEPVHRFSRMMAGIISWPTVEGTLLFALRRFVLC
jgi:hypothetical protein